MSCAVALADKERAGTRTGAEFVEVSDTCCAADGDMFGDAGFEVDADTDADVGIAFAWAWGSVVGGGIEGGAAT
jgi:hypothetical protein